MSYDAIWNLMDDDLFAANLAEWSDFHILAGTAAATLLGLVFIAISLSPAVMADDGPVGLRAFAGQTFGNFLIVLVIALVCLIPDQTPVTLGVTLCLISLLDLRRSIQRIGQVRRDPDPIYRSPLGVLRFGLPTLANVLLLLLSVAMIWAAEAALAWLVAVIFFLLSGSAISAWQILTEMGQRNWALTLTLAPTSDAADAIPHATPPSTESRADESIAGPIAR